MSQPTPYTPSTDFSQQEAINASGRSTVNTSALDAELANIETTLDQALANMSLLQRDDGRLKDMACELHTISPEVLNLMGGFRTRGLWTADTEYSVKDLASNTEYTYLCKTAHTSGSSFDEQFWTQFGFSGGADAAQAAAAAQVSASNANSSANAAAASAATASAAASTATTQAGNAATSAGTATTQAGNAATSATNASNSATAAQTAAANLPNAPTAGSNKFLKSNAAGTAWEYLTALAARAALGLGIGTDVMAHVAPGASGNVLTSTGSAWVSQAPAADVSGRRLAQIVTYQTGAIATGTTIIPFDNTIPQNTEGTQFLAVSITPTDALSSLEVDITLHVNVNTANSYAVAGLFQDSQAGAIAAAVCLAPSTAIQVLTFKHILSAGSLTETTFKVRAGPTVAGTINVNGQASTGYLGGVLASRITVKEYLP